MKLGKRSHWIIIFAILLMSLAISLTQVDAVQATFSDRHMFGVMLRVESEIMQKTPVGQYYDALFWKHSEEIAQLITANPGKYEELVRVNRLFIPGLEALLDGKGDTVRITSEQVEGFKTQLAWFSSKGSPALQEDIERERQRLPLDNFADLTMIDALDLINSSWSPDMIVPETLAPDLVAQQTPLPDPTPEQAVKQTLATGSNGKWAYHVHDGIYFEYPGSYYLQNSKPTGHFEFILSTGTPKQRDPYEIIVHIWKVPYAEKDNLSPDYWYPAENVVWERNILNQDFEGLEFASRSPSTQGVNLDAIQYNPKNQIAIHVVCMYIDKDPLLPDGLDDLAMIDQRYEYFQHMVDRIHMQTP